MPLLASNRFDEIRKNLAQEGKIFTAGLELTYRCNFECLHCYCVVGGPRKELSTTEVLSLLDDLKAAGCLTVTLTGGEAMLRPDFFEIAEYAKKLRFVIRLFTNAFLLDDELRARRVLALNPISVDISLYGASEEAYERVTGHRAFAKVTKAIDTLLSKGQRMLIKIPLMQENYGDLDAMIAFCESRKLSFNVDPWMTPKDDGTMDPKKTQISDEQLREFFRRYGNKKKPGKRSVDEPLCTIGRGSVIVGPYGDVHACVQSKLSVGNIREKPISEIWENSPLLQKERELKLRDYPECRACEFRNSCFICSAVSFYENGRFNGFNPHACKVAQTRHELGQIESEPVFFQILVPGKDAEAGKPSIAQAGVFPG